MSEFFNDGKDSLVVYSFMYGEYFAKRWREEVVQLLVEAKLRHRWRPNINEAHGGTLVIGVVGAFHGGHHRCVGPLLLPFADGLSSRVSWRVFVRAVIADDGLHRAYGERGAFLTADGERDGAQNHAILPTIETVSIRAFAGRAEARSRPYHETLVSIARADGDAAYAISKASLNALTLKLASFVVILPVVSAAAR